MSDSIPRRWATHGEVSDANAHPHSSDPDGADAAGGGDGGGRNQFVVVHNGAIENHRELRQLLQVRQG